MNKELTPVFRQYTEQKSAHKDAVLFFRLGDFYEMFYSDAVEISRLLNLTLTQRQGIPMCGVPYHAVNSYIGRLLKLGKKIAVCEQVEMPPGGKGLARREVVEVVTPGTVVDDTFLSDSENNYLVSLVNNGKETGFACIDLSTGEFRATLLKGTSIKDALRCELAKTNPREIIIQQSLLNDEDFIFLQDDNILLNRIPDWSMDIEDAAERLKRQFKTVNLKAFSLEEGDARSLAAGVILEYMEENCKNLVPHINTLVCYDEGTYLGLDDSTIRNLELIRNLQDGGKNYTLLETLNHTKTSGGARLLRKRLLQPFRDAKTIGIQHSRVEKIYHNQAILTELRNILGATQDLERLVARTGMDRAHAKDLVAVRNTLTKFLALHNLIDPALWEAPEEEMAALVNAANAIVSLLEQSLLDEPSILLTEGQLIQEGWDSEIDKLKAIKSQGRQLLENYIAEEKAATGLSSLKLKTNRVMGYFIEVSKTQAASIPERFRRRQSLSQAERFVTDRLEELEIEITSVDERLIDREREVFLTIRNKVKENIHEMLHIANLLSHIDLVQSYAHAATEYGYVRPQVEENILTEIHGGRHPVVEKHLPQGAFVPNDIHLARNEQSFALVTGPNMAGKSTVLRQVALITLMTQAGSFIPADEAKIGIADKIFCRVGASDNLARGESTFLVEMNETAKILRNATSRSLVIMDEVGRGTGTDDGLAIARAVCEYLLDHQSPRTLFATHYRELTTLVHAKLVNLSMSVQETGNTIVFPKKLVSGPAEASYGIHVAALAGLPEEAVNRARTLLETANLYQHSDPCFSAQEASEPMLFDPREIILTALSSINLDTLKSAEALKILKRWQSDILSLK